MLEPPESPDPQSDGRQARNRQDRRNEGVLRQVKDRLDLKRQSDVGARAKSYDPKDQQERGLEGIGETCLAKPRSAPRP